VTQPRPVSGGRRPSLRAARLQILAAAVLWGTTGTSQALAPEGATPLAVASLRVALGGVTLVAVAATGGVLRRMPPGPVITAGACLLVAQLSFFASVARTGVAVGTVVSIGSAPLIAGAIGYLLRGERPGPRWAAATLLGLGGCALLLAGGRSIDVDPIGVALALVVGAGYAGYTVASKDLIERHPPDSVTAAAFAVAGLCMVPFLLAADIGWVTEPRGFVIVAHLGVLTVGLAYALFARGLTVVATAPAVTLTLAEPLTAGALGVVVLGEHLTPAAGTGIAMMLAGLVLLAWPEREDAAKSPAASTMDL